MVPPLLLTSATDVQASERPDDEEAEKATKETRAALDRLVEGKISAAQPKTLPAGPGAPQFIKYTPSQQGSQYNSGAGQRIIRMQVYLPPCLPALPPSMPCSCCHVSVTPRHVPCASL